jgi:FkbM family methyltransferase
LQNVKVYNIGFGERVGKAFMDFQQSTVLGQVSYESGKYEILLDTIDSFVEREKIPKIDILKIDAEGFEFLILKSALKTLAITERIVLECSPQFEPEVGKLLLPYNFKPVSRLPQYNVIFFARENSP